MKKSKKCKRCDGTGLIGWSLIAIGYAYKNAPKPAKCPDCKGKGKV